MEKMIVYIKGMHCVSCEIMLEKELRKIEDVKWCKVSHRKGAAKIGYSGEKPIDKIKAVVEKCGYKIAGDKQTGNEVKERKNTFNDYMEITMIAIFTIAVAAFLKRIEIMRLLPDIDNEVSIAIAVMLGIVASVSTCLALTGGLVLSFGNVYKIHEDTKHPLISKSIPHIYFHIGRIGGFAILGGVLGFFGSKIDYSATFSGYLTIFIAAVMLYIGLHILNIVPNITKLGFHLPKALSRKIHSLEGNDHHLTPMLLGVLTFFLPCGFTQSMQLAAIASQSATTGALIMGAFALGTMPVLLSIGIGSTYAKGKDFGFFKKFIGVIVIFFALYSLNSGLILANTGISLTALESAKNSQLAESTNGSQTVKMDIDWSFRQNQFTIKKDIPVRWEINGINVSGCSNEIVIPALNIRKKISKGLNVIEFTPKVEGTLPFSCWMGMLNGRFIVTK